MIEGYVREADTPTRWWRSILESATSAFSVRVHIYDEVGAETESCYAVDHETPRPDIHEIRVLILLPSTVIASLSNGLGLPGLLSSA